MKYETELAACRAWVQEFNAIPAALIVRAFPPDKMDELELLAGGKDVSDCCDADADDGKCSACEEQCETHTIGAEYAWPAGWSTLWTPDGMDEEWIRDHAAEVAEKCGFLVYESDETGILLGIDGGGYDFFDQHWLPLYRLRGLQWHEPPAPEKKEAGVKEASKGDRVSFTYRGEQGTGTVRRVKKDGTRTVAPEGDINEGCWIDFSPARLTIVT